MELIYLYIRNYENYNSLNDKFKNHQVISRSNFRIINKGINFSNNFQCKFDIDNKNTGKLVIKKINEKKDTFYNDSIASLKAFVGKNGSGKTTVMDILGMPRRDRITDHQLNGQFTAEYFLVYHIKADIFAMELAINHNEKKYDWWITNLNKNKLTNYGEKKSGHKENVYNKPPNGFLMKYDYEKEDIKISNQHFFDERRYSTYKEKLKDQIKFYYISNTFSHRINSNQNIYKDDHGYLLKRQYSYIGLNSPQTLKMFYENFSRNTQFSRLIDSNLILQMEDKYSNNSFSTDFDELSDNSSAKSELEEIRIKIKNLKEIIYESDINAQKSTKFSDKVFVSGDEKKIDKEALGNNSKEKYLFDLLIRYIINGFYFIITSLIKSNKNNLDNNESGSMSRN